VIAMPMPHRTQMQVIKRRLVGKEGGERIKELRAILAELPGYKSGPYADIRKWVAGQIEEARVRKKTVHRDSIAVRRQGAAQIAFVGPPNAGKSSLLQALSSIQIKTGDYAFTTTRPVPAVTRIHGVPVQLVEIPGLIKGATDDRGGGRALLGVLRGADAMILCQDATASLDGLRSVQAELEATGIEKRTLVAVTKLDEAAPERVAEISRQLGLQAVGVSVLDDRTVESFREALWRLTGLMRVYLRRPGGEEREPQALSPGATVADAARAVHHALGETCAGARVSGSSVKFDHQRVGRDHVLADGDTVEIV
jgi:small GTP-binding protein